MKTPDSVTPAPAETSVSAGGAIPATAPTPIWISRRARTTLLVVGLLVAGLLIYFAPSVPKLTIGGFALALVLSFPVRAMSQVMPRWLAMLLSLLLAFGLLTLFLVVLTPILLQQLGALVEGAPSIAQSIEDRVPSVLDWLFQRGLLPTPPEEFIGDLRTGVLDAIQGFAGRVFASLGEFVSGVIGMIVTLVGVLFVGIYMLADARRIEAFLIWNSPHRYRRDTRELWDSFSVTLSRYLGGLALSLAIQGLLSAAALYFLGVPYALLLGAWVAVTALVPFIGAWIGAVPAIALALTISPTRAVLTAVLFLLIQQLEGNVLTPRIQGQAVRVHPIVVFIAVIAGGELFGLAGVIFAVPALAMMRVLTDFLRVRLRVRSDHPPLVAPASSSRAG